MALTANANAEEIYDEITKAHKKTREELFSPQAQFENPALQIYKPLLDLPKIEAQTTQPVLNLFFAVDKLYKEGPSSEYKAKLQELQDSLKHTKDQNFTSSIQALLNNMHQVKPIELMETSERLAELNKATSVDYQKMAEEIIRLETILDELKAHSTKFFSSEEGKKFLNAQAYNFSIGTLNKVNNAFLHHVLPKRITRPFINEDETPISDQHYQNIFAIVRELGKKLEQNPSLISDQVKQQIEEQNYEEFLQIRKFKSLERELNTGPGNIDKIITGKTTTLAALYQASVGQFIQLFGGEVLHNIKTAKELKDEQKSYLQKQAEKLKKESMEKILKANPAFKKYQDLSEKHFECIESILQKVEELKKTKPDSVKTLETWRANSLAVTTAMFDFDEKPSKESLKVLSKKLDELYQLEETSSISKLVPEIAKFSKVLTKEVEDIVAKKGKHISTEAIFISSPTPDTTSHNVMKTHTETVKHFRSYIHSTKDPILDLATLEHLTKLHKSERFLKSYVHQLPKKEQALVPALEATVKSEVSKSEKWSELYSIPEDVVDQTIKLVKACKTVLGDTNAMTTQLELLLKEYQKLEHNAQNPKILQYAIGQITEFAKKDPNIAQALNKPSDQQEFSTRLASRMDDLVRDHQQAMKMKDTNTVVKPVSSNLTPQQQSKVSHIATEIDAATTRIDASTSTSSLGSHHHAHHKHNHIRPSSTGRTR